MALLYNLIPALATHPTFRPPTLTRAELRDKSHLESLQSALTSNGIVAISQIDNYSSLRVAALRAANACHKPALHTFSDGTTRATSAATPDTAVEGCDATDPSLTQFRALVGDVTTEFAEALSAIVGGDGPTLMTAGTRQLHTVADVFRSGEQLEHFHSYQRPLNGASNAAGATLELHTDQGLFIAFTPALTIGSDDVPLAAFWLQLADGSTAEALLRPETLVFMLGDGVEQFVSPHRAALRPPLRAAPHALTVHPSDHGGQG